jgi:hypothetical protein
MREFSMNTVQRSPSRDGHDEEKAHSANSSFTETFSLRACSSRKLPVPAAHTLFISKSTMTPSSMEMYFESCPPISKIVSTAGSMKAAAVAWAVISFFTMSALTKSAIMYLPDPVVPIPAISTRSPSSAAVSRSPCRTASMGRPAVIRYRFRRSLPLMSITATFVLMEPTSIPM